nr:hypothetical protein [Tanacetum cinerariifolium]
MIKEHDQQAKMKATPRKLAYADSVKEAPARSLARGFSDRFSPDSSLTSDTHRQTRAAKHDQQAKMKATPRKLAYADSVKEAPARSLARRFSDRFSPDSSLTSDTHRQTRAASKSQRTPSKNKELTHLRRSGRLEDRSITKEKARRERSKSRRKRSGHQETSSNSEHEEDPIEIHGIKRRQNEGLQAFMDRFKSKSSHIKGVPSVLCILAFMYGRGHPELAKKLNDKIPKTGGSMGMPIAKKGVRLIEGGLNFGPVSLAKTWEKEDTGEVCIVSQERPDRHVTMGTTLTAICKQLVTHVLQENKEVFAWARSKRTFVPRFVMEHQLKIYPLAEPMVYKRRPMAPEGRLALKEKVQVDYSSLNKVCDKDMYPFLKKGEGLASIMGYSYKCFLRHLKEYSQIRMTDDDEEKTGFHTKEGVYCFTHMPKELEKLSSYTLEDDGEDIEETLRKLKRVNIKIDPVTSSFEVKEGRFLGYMVTKEGTNEAEEALQRIKRKLNKLQKLAVPKEGEILMLCLCHKDETKSFVLLVEREGIQIPVSYETLDANERGTLNLNNELQAKSTPTPRAWRLYLGKETIEEGSSVGIILVSPEERMHSYAIRLKFNTSDHAIDCEALLAGLAVSVSKGMKDLHVFMDSPELVAQTEGNHTPTTKQERKYKKEIMDATTPFYGFRITHLPKILNSKVEVLTGLATIKLEFLNQEV